MEAISRAIGAISANWDGLRPQLLLERVTVYDAAQLTTTVGATGSGVSGTVLMPGDACELRGNPLSAGRPAEQVAHKNVTNDTNREWDARLALCDTGSRTTRHSGQLIPVMDRSCA